VFTNVLQNAPAGKTRLLVTHALHFLPQVDYIYTMVDGRIAERGTYAELMANEREFARFVREFGSKVAREEEEEEEREKEKEAAEGAGVEEEAKKVEKRRKAIQGKALMQAEERNTGAISGGVYAAYIRAGQGTLLVPFLIFSLTLIQGATVLSSYWCVLGCVGCGSKMLNDVMQARVVAGYDVQQAARILCACFMVPIVCKHADWRLDGHLRGARCLASDRVHVHGLYVLLPHVLRVAEFAPGRDHAGDARAHVVLRDYGRSSHTDARMDS
jgi:hypothetical protein